MTQGAKIVYVSVADAVFGAVEATRTGSAPKLRRGMRLGPCPQAFSLFSHRRMTLDKKLAFQ
jgi:hypothetical protein